MSTRTYYALSYLDAEGKRIEGDDHAKVVRRANKLADKVGATVQVRKYIVTGERFYGDPLGTVDAVGDVEEYDGTGSDRARK